jgi:hypothetical protein
VVQGKKKKYELVNNFFSTNSSSDKDEFKKQLELKVHSSGPLGGAKNSDDHDSEDGSMIGSMLGGEAEGHRARVKGQKSQTKKPRCKAVFDYEKGAEGEISFQEGDIIYIRLKDESGWWQGELGESVGWFPANFVEEIAPEVSFL